MDWTLCLDVGDANKNPLVPLCSFYRGKDGLAGSKDPEQEHTSGMPLCLNTVASVRLPPHRVPADAVINLDPCLICSFNKHLLNTCDSHRKLSVLLAFLAAGRH